MTNPPTKLFRGLDWLLFWVVGLPLAALLGLLLVAWDQIITLTQLVTLTPRSRWTAFRFRPVPIL